MYAKNAVLYRNGGNFYNHCYSSDSYYENLPKSWLLTTVEKSCILLSERDLSSDKYDNNSQNSTPYITGASNFHNGQITTDGYTKFPQVIAQKNDLLITVKGTIGELAILKLEKAHIARQIMAIHPLAIDTQYVFLVLKNSIEQLKQQAQSMIPGISRNVLLKSEIPLPPISEQRQICQTISLIDSQLQKLS